MKLQFKEVVIFDYETLEEEFIGLEFGKENWWNHIRIILNK